MMRQKYETRSPESPTETIGLSATSASQNEPGPIAAYTSYSSAGLAGLCLSPYCTVRVHGDTLLFSQCVFQEEITVMVTGNRADRLLEILDAGMDLDCLSAAVSDFLHADDAWAKALVFALMRRGMLE